MPIYEFLCQACGHPFEELVRLGSPLKDISCPACRQGPVVKKISLVASASGARGPSSAASASAACTTST
jgi:putative FmdB family regulatory protein